MNNEEPKVVVLKRKVVVLLPQQIKSTERTKGLLIPTVHSFRGIRAYDELQICGVQLKSGPLTKP